MMNDLYYIKLGLWSVIFKKMLLAKIAINVIGCHE